MVNPPPGPQGAPRVEPSLSLLDPAAVDQDDMCFWVHPSDTALSTIITSDKKADSLFVYDLEGRTLQTVPTPKPGNIDVRYGFPLGGGRVDIVAFNQRKEGHQILVFTVDPETRLLERADNGKMVTKPGYGGTLFRSPKTGRFYFVKTAKDESVIEQFELFEDGGGRIAGRPVRQWQLSISEGAVGNDRTGTLYIAEERVGIWALGGEPDDPAPGRLVARVGEDGLMEDVEGLAIYHFAGGDGYLIVSNQGADTFKVFRLGDELAPAGDFRVAGAFHTDGIDVLNTPLGDRYPRGLFACHTARDVAAGERCPVHVTPWESVAGALGLEVDTGWHPRRA